jgi:hypothetical protein
MSSEGILMFPKETLGVQIPKGLEETMKDSRVNSQGNQFAHCRNSQQTYHRTISDTMDFHSETVMLQQGFQQFSFGVYQA